MIFDVIFNDTTQEKVTDTVKEELTNNPWLGKFFIVTNTITIINVTTERLTNPPDVQVDDVETSSTPLMLDSSSKMLSQGPSSVMLSDKMSDDISSFNQTSTAMEMTEATTTVSESDTTLFLTSATMTVDHTITLSSTPSLPDETTDLLTDTVTKSFFTTSAETTIQDSISNQITKTYISSQESETMRMSKSFASISTANEILVQMSTEDQSISTNVVESINILSSFKTTPSTYESALIITTFPDDVNMSSTMPQTLSSTRFQESMISTDISTTSLGDTSIDQRLDEESKSILTSLGSLDTVSITPTVTDDFTSGSVNEMTEVRSVSESTIQEQEPMFSSTIPVEMTSSLINDTTEAPTTGKNPSSLYIIHFDNTLSFTGRYIY